jgi:hypothetical protein
MFNAVMSSGLTFMTQGTLLIEQPPYNGSTNGQNIRNPLKPDGNYTHTSCFNIQ